MIYDITHALHALVPGAVWVHRGEPMDFTGIEWLDNNIAQPSEAAITYWVEQKNIVEPMRLLRIERDKRLAATDWWTASDRTITDEQKQYRQALRDLTEVATPSLLPNGKLDMSSVEWPVNPNEPVVIPEPVIINVSNTVSNTNYRYGSIQQVQSNE